jgi:uncharacterized lipoprotein YddW (UPF0748 family)
MKKRDFIKTLGCGAAAYLIAGPMAGCGPGRAKKEVIEEREPVEGMPRNWIWMRPETGFSDDEWRRKFDRMADAGIEAVLPQIFNSHFALFDLPGFTVKERLLERLIPLAHSSGLQVHAWMWTMPMNNQEILQRHPDWFAVNGKGEPSHEKPAYVDYYKFLDPCHPEVQDFIEARVEALGKIEDLDGIHLDYVRLPDVILAEALQPKYNIVQDREYPEYDYSYSTLCREQFKAQTGIDPMELEDPSLNMEWLQFRYDSVTNLVNGRLIPMARKYGKTVTAAVFPNWESVRQQWHKWDLDAFLPMLYHGFYNADIAWIGEEIKAAHQRLGEPKPVFSGLFLPDLTPEELTRAIETSIQAGAAGISLFDFELMSDEHWATLEKALRK